MSRERGTLGAVKGSMRETRPGVWQLRVGGGKDPDTGRYRTVTRTARGSRGTAEKALARLVRQVGAGQEQAAPKTVGWLLDAHLANLERLGRAETTLRTYRAYRKRTEPIEAIRLDALSAAHLDGLYRALADQGLASATVRQVHAILRGALSQAKKWDLVDRNVAELATLPRMKQREVHPPTVAQVRDLLTAAEKKDPVLACMLWMAATTGARRGEVCALRWSDVDLEAGTVTIARSLMDLPGGPVEKDTKTHAVRAVALDPATVVMLTAHRAKVEAVLHAQGVEWDPAGWVFTVPVGDSDPVRPDWVTRSFVRLAAQAKMPGVRLHDLRHFVATTAVASGADLRTIAGRLGHSGGGAVTMRVYAHVLAERDRDLADTLGRALSG
jgi:integrase